MQTWQVGNVKITKIVEQLYTVPGEFIVKGASPKAVLQHPWLVPNYADENGNLIISTHAFVVETQGKTIVVDTCVGNDKSQPVIKDWENLQTTFLKDFTDAGFSRESIDMVLCTHLHEDHVGWNTLLENGKWVPTFPNAKYFFSATEWQHWKKEQGFEGVFNESLQPILDAKLECFIQAPYQISNEVNLVATPGHTPGHVSIEINSNNQKAVITGDIMHNPVQCAEPNWPATADHDPELAIETRLNFLQKHAGSNTLILGTHFPSPSGGNIESRAKHWKFKKL